MILKIKTLHEKAICPVYKSLGASGADHHACIASPIEILPYCQVTIPTGIAIEMPEGYAGEICSRSGLTREHSIYVLNSPAIIDNDYRGELLVVLHNLRRQSFTIEHGMRIAQLLVVARPRVQIAEVEELTDTVRGTNGFGSTGI